MSRKQHKYECGICGKGLGNEAAHAKHVSIEHGARTVKAVKPSQIPVARPLLVLPPIPKDAAHHCPECNTYFSDPDAAAECREAHIPPPSQDEMDYAKSKALELERMLSKKQQIPPPT